MDTLLNIAIRTNYHTISALICTCKYYSEYPNIWKLACEIQFPTKPYFDFWTGKENYLVHERKYFALPINFTMEDVADYIYEYDQMLIEILSLSSDLIHFGMGYAQHELLKITVESQFIVVLLRNYNFDAKEIGQCSTYTEAEEMIQASQLTFSDDGNISEIYFTYAIVDLINLRPFCWKIKPREPNEKSIKTKFYTGSNNEPIIFQIKIDK
jgi:hypothetical protein